MLELRAGRAEEMGAKAGDKVSVTWKDNRGDTRTDEAVVS